MFRRPRRNQAAPRNDNERRRPRLLGRLFHREVDGYPDPPSRSRRHDVNRPSTASIIVGQLSHRLLGLRINERQQADPNYNRGSAELAAQIPPNPDEPRVAIRSREALLMLNQMQPMDGVDITQSLENRRDFFVDRIYQIPKLNEHGEFVRDIEGNVVMEDIYRPPNEVFQQLIQCDTPPNNDDNPNEFRALFLKTLLKLWGVQKYLEENDTRFRDRFNLEKRNNPNQDLHELAYSILTGEILSEEERSEIHENIKRIEDYTVSEILALWNASDQFVFDRARGRNIRGSFLRNHPYPIGGAGGAGLHQLREKLEQYYHCPNVILALYIYTVTRAFEERRLKAFQTKLGLMSHGYHWIIFRENMETSLNQVGIPGVDICITTLIRLTGFANSVVCGYHSLISDDNATYTINGEMKSYGIEFMYNEAHTNHLLCFCREHLQGSVYADKCISLKYHSACSHRRVNNSDNTTCKGSHVMIYRDLEGRQVRALHSHCTCGSSGGNPSGARCNFSFFSDFRSAADQIECVTPVSREDGTDGYNYTYINNTARRNSTTNAEEQSQSQGRSMRSAIAVRDELAGESSEASFDSRQTIVTFPNNDEYCFVAFDSETTGRNPRTCRLLEYASLPLEASNALDGSPTYISEYVNPGVESPHFEMSQGAFAKNKISRSMLYGKKKTRVALGTLFDHWDEIRQGRKLCLVGHNIESFDLPLLYHEARRFDMEARLNDIFYIDTLQLARDNRVWENIRRERPDSLKLGNIYEELFGERIIGYHCAFPDAAACARVLECFDEDLSFSLQSGYIHPSNTLIERLASRRRGHEEMN